MEVTEGANHEGNGWRGAMDVRVGNLEEEMRDMKAQVRSIEQTIWKAGGFVSAVVVVIDLLLRVLK